MFISCLCAPVLLGGRRVRRQLTSQIAACQPKQQTPQAPAQRPEANPPGVGPSHRPSGLCVHVLLVLLPLVKMERCYISLPLSLATRARFPWAPFFDRAALAFSGWVPGLDLGQLLWFGLAATAATTEVHRRGILPLALGPQLVL